MILISKVKGIPYFEEITKILLPCVVAAPLEEDSVEVLIPVPEC